MSSFLENLVKPYTYATPEQIRLLSRLVWSLDENNVMGDLVECGVFNGGSAAILAHFAARSKFSRRVWLFDSFEGLPTPTDKDKPSASGQKPELAVGACKGDINAVNHILGLVGADMSKVEIVKGRYQDTFPTVSIPQIAFLSLDSDWYEAEKSCMEKFYPNVVPKGIVYSDDFYWWPGCQKAISEYFGDTKPMFNRVPSMWMEK